MDYYVQKGLLEDNLSEVKEPAAAYNIGTAPVKSRMSFKMHDPFYSAENQALLLRRARDVENGKNLACHGLIEIEDG
jgi:hypothetical protein